MLSCESLVLALYFVFAGVSIEHSYAQSGVSISNGNSHQDATLQSLIDTLFRMNSFLPGGDFDTIAEPIILDFLNNAMATGLGGNIKASHYEGAGNLGPIKCASDLNCTFDKPCRWRVDKRTDLRFYTGNGKPDTQVLDVLTGVSEDPEPPFLIGAGNEGSKAAWLVSDQIPIQPGDGVVEFKTWLTPLVLLRVCTRDAGQVSFTFCSQPFESADGGYRANQAVLIPGPINKPFEIVFEVSNFLVSPGGLGFLDDIFYHSETCGEGKPRMPSNVNTTNDKSASSANKSPAAAVETVKLRASAKSESGSSAKVADSGSAGGGADSESSGQRSPAGEAASPDAGRQTGRQRGQQTGRQTGGQDVSGDAETRGKQRAVPSPREGSRASNSASSETGGQRKSPEHTKSSSKETRYDDEICMNVRCNFNHGNLCQYTSLYTDNANPFQWRKGGIGDAASKGGYISADGADWDARKSSQFIMESAPFTLKYPVDIEFYRWQEAPDAELSVCVNSISNCVRSFRQPTSGWSLASVRLKPSDSNRPEQTTLIFIAERLGPEDFVAIDNIDTPSADCFLPA